MSPNHPAYAPYARMVVNLVHEFAHCVSIRINPRIPNNPRWLWESVAIFEAGQSTDLRRLPYLAALTPPPFGTLNRFDNTLVYDMGYSIARFIVDRWGQPALRALILSEGNVAATLGVDQAAFEADWFAAARSRSGF